MKNHIRILRVCSLFSGCGGMDYGFHNNKQFQVVYANDYDKDACNTYKNYYGISPQCCDIKDAVNIPPCDILLGGFPCQGFSIANKNRNVNDSRNKLYLELVKLLKLKQPKYFIFENVRGILSIGGYSSPKHKEKKLGKVFCMICHDFIKCGYVIHTKLFRMKYYGIPQNRERVIFVGVREDIASDVVFSWTKKTNEQGLTLRTVIGDLPAEYVKTIQHIGTQHKVKITGYMGNRKLDWDQIAPTITGRGSGTGGPVINIHPNGCRRMTVREYARIQTFPDDFMFCGSVSSMYRQIGNAVPPKFSKILADLIIQMETSLLKIND